MNEEQESKPKISCRTNEKIADFIDYMIERAIAPTCEGCRFREPITAHIWGCSLKGEPSLPNCGAIADLLIEVGILKTDSTGVYSEVTE